MRSIILALLLAVVVVQVTAKPTFIALLPLQTQLDIVNDELANVFFINGIRADVLRLRRANLIARIAALTTTAAPTTVKA